MKVLAVPGRLRLAALLIVLCIPLAALEIVLYFRAPWWNLPYFSMTAGSILAVSVFAPLGLLMAHGRRTAWTCSALLAFGWVSGTTAVAINDRNFWLGISVILLASFWISLLSWIRSEMGRSFFDPRMAWFEGRPRGIPGLHCELASGESKHELMVSRLDRDGLFAFQARGRVGAFGEKGRAKSFELVLEYRGRKVACTARAMRLLQDAGGVGLKFSDNPPDRLKELGDFVELLRGEGYVG